MQVVAPPSWTQGYRRSVRRDRSGPVRSWLMAQSDVPEPGLPLKLEPCSNGEYLPTPASRIVRRTIEETNRLVDVRSRRLGMSRRQFLQSSAGMATMMTVLAACSRDEGEVGGQFTTEPTSTAAPQVDPTATAPPATTPPATAPVSPTDPTPVSYTHLTLPTILLV